METLHFVGLDVHRDSIVIAVADSGRSESRSLGTIASDLPALIRKLRRLGPSEAVCCCYEAGPTGFGLQRDLEAAGIRCQVVAPSLTPTRAGDRVKTDRRDAKNLAHFLRSGDLTSVHVPDRATEAIRDLERARDDGKCDERAARHRLCKFLLRHGRRYEGKTHWTATHLDWIRTQAFDHVAQAQALSEYLHVVEEATERVARLTKAIEESVENWTLAPLVKAMQALRGIQLVTAVAIVAEVADFRRFPNARQFMAYVGLVPSEHSTGLNPRRGGITKTGNRHVRRLLVESAWSYRFSPRMSRIIRRRNEGLSLEVRRIAWKAQHRLHGRYRRLSARGKKAQQVVTAIARELAGFIWAIARQETLLAA